MLRDLIILIDSLSISLGMGLSITLKAGVEQLRWAIAQRSEHLHVAEAGDSGSIPGSCLGFFFSSWLTNVDEMIRGTIVQFDCYQHRYKWGKGSMVL